MCAYFTSDPVLSPVWPWVLRLNSFLEPCDDASFQILCPSCSASNAPMYTRHTLCYPNNPRTTTSTGGKMRSLSPRHSIGFHCIASRHIYTDELKNSLLHLHRRSATGSVKKKKKNTKRWFHSIAWRYNSREKKHKGAYK